MMEETKICELANSLGFYDAAFLDVQDLVIKPEYRKYCEMNTCHQYDANPACPPKCGTVEELVTRVRGYRRALVLQTLCDSDFLEDAVGGKAAKMSNNKLTDQLLSQLPSELTADILRMSAGPWRQNSCLSAYCVDAQSLADSVGMTCWANDGKCRFFSVILFR